MLLFYINCVIFYNLLERPIQDSIGFLLEELKSKRPKTPPLPPSLISDDKFCEYLCSIMEKLTKAKKIKLQAKFINNIVNQF